MRTQRQLKVGEEVRHALARMLERGDVPWPHDFSPPIVTISEVQISPDLQNATAFFTVMGAGADADEARSVLNKLVGFFRCEVAKTVRLRLVPRLDFKVDASTGYATKIERILHDPAVAKDLIKREPSTLADATDDDLS